MPLATGTKLGVYEILSPLGAGGMGEVYRASDSRLGREVAIKILPDAFARDPERLARFEREAKVLASLNHPNIAAIYGLEEHAGTPFLVLEFAPGETLRGPLPVEEALAICRQIAEALEAAHEKGIVHRDLKPANVKMSADGKVKVLDFGLAKAYGAESIAAAALSHSPTITAGMATGGVLLGTAAYMSPEQARGKPADQRADIWAFGCVLYELLTGKMAFGGETVSDSIAFTLARDPAVEALPPSVPANIKVLLRRCLQKDPARRLQHIGDARLEIEETLSGTVAAAAPVAQAFLPVRSRWKSALPLATATALLAALAVWLFVRPTAQAPPGVARLTVPVQNTVGTLGSSVSPLLAISPDGSRLVYTGLTTSDMQLFVRPLDQEEGVPIAGTEGGGSPFFSPDGQWLGFFGNGKLKKVAVTGGAAQDLCDAATSRGAEWAPDGTIYFTPSPTGGILRIPASGGAPTPLTKTAPGEQSHRWLELLPGGEHLLFTVWASGAIDTSTIDAVSLKTGERRTVVRGGSYPIYARSGHLLYMTSNGLMAVPFDAVRLEVRGAPVPVLQGFNLNTAAGNAHVVMSDNGALFYMPGGPRQERTVELVDRAGKERLLMEPKQAFLAPRFSPDGRRVALSVTGATQDVWVFDSGRGTMTRLTFQSTNFAPVWTPDGKRVTYSALRGGPPNIFWTPADGSGSEERLTTSESPQFPADWSPDGRVLLYTEISSTGPDVWLLPLDDRKPRPFLKTHFAELAPVFSPDGKWVAYQSNEAGRFQIVVQPFPGPGGKWMVSTDGGTGPAWRGNEIFYRNGDKTMAVAVSTKPTFSAGKPRLLFETTTVPTGQPILSYDVSLDGKQFVFVKGMRESGPTRLALVLNWTEELKKKVPGKGN